MEILKQLLPKSTNLQLVNWHLDEAETQITLIVSSKQTVVPCPVCAFPTHRIHSHYERLLADLSWAEDRVSWLLQVRKYFCLNQQCQRRIFTERLPGIVAPWARRTQRLAEQLSAIVLGARILLNQLNAITLRQVFLPAFLRLEFGNSFAHQLDRFRDPFVVGFGFEKLPGSSFGFC